MANKDEATATTLSDPETGLGSPQSQMPEPRGQAEPGQETESAPQSAAEPPEPAPDLPGSEPPVRPEPALAQPKPRSLFPALAATAVAGAVLGIGGSFALRSFEEGPHNKPAIPNVAASEEQIETLSARLDALEKRSDAASAALRDSLAAIEGRIAAAETAAAKAAEVADSAKADAQTAAARAPGEAAPGSPQPESPTEPLDLAAVGSRLASLEQRLASLEQQPAGRKADLRAEPSREGPEAKQASRAQAIAVVAGSLLRKLETGGPFASEVNALEGLGVAQNLLAPLRAVPQSSVAREPQLAARFAALAPKIVASESAGPGKGEETFLDRLARSAKGLVRIRRTGESEGSDAESLVARIETALGEHDLEAAVKAWQELPAAAKDVSQDWGRAAKIRLDALQAARSIEADAVAAIGKPKS